MAQFDILSINGGDLSVFLGKKELEVLNLISGLAALGFPLEVSSVCMLAISDQLLVQFVVLFDKPLVLFLERDHGLTIE